MRIQGGAVFSQDGQFHKRDLYAEDGVFTTAAAGPVIDATDCYVIPGLVDIHTHGAMGCDVSDADAQGLQTMSRWYAQQGTTTFLATTMTLPEAQLQKAVSNVRDFTPAPDGAACAGIHLEGPFISLGKRGAQAAAHVHAPDAAMFHRLQDACGGAIRLLTLAPEEPGALAFIRRIAQECVVSLGHTGADYETACAAYAAGACHATHLFNAMPPFSHRAPGVVGAAADCATSAEIVCDGLHLHPSIVRAAGALFGTRLVLISDSIRCAGMPDGDYSLGGQPVVMKSGKATLLDGTIAGSSICLLDAVRCATAFGLGLERAIYAATAAPAKAARLDATLGTIAPGKQADCLLLRRDLRLRQVILRGIPQPQQPAIY